MVLRDHGDAADFRVLQLGGGECAGASQQKIGTLFFEAAHERNYRDALKFQRKYSEALTCAEASLTAVARALGDATGVQAEDLAGFVAQLSAIPDTQALASRAAPSWPTSSRWKKRPVSPTSPRSSRASMPGSTRRAECVPAARSDARAARSAAPAGAPLRIVWSRLRYDAVAQVGALPAKIAAPVEALECDRALEHAPAALSSSLARRGHGPDRRDPARTDMPSRSSRWTPAACIPRRSACLPRVHDRYGYEIRVYRPDAGAVDRYVDEFGLDAFYDSIELRQRCCQIRKVEPLKRALAGKTAWVTGMRRAQVGDARDLPESEFDAQYRLWKFNPLADWSEAEVWQYIRAIRSAVQPAARPGLPQHRLRAVHARHRGRRRSARRPLVVGRTRRTRNADCTSVRAASRRQSTKERAHESGKRGTSPASRQRRQASTQPSRLAGVRGVHHSARGGGRVPQPGAAVLRRQGLCGGAAARRKSIPPGADSLHRSCTSTPATTFRR